MWISIMAISTGAALGALVRWRLGNALNSLFPTIPPGTLAANVIGAYLIGVSIAFFAQHPSLAPEWRLLIVTGFLGARRLSGALSQFNIHQRSRLRSRFRMIIFAPKEMAFLLQ